MKLNFTLSPFIHTISKSFIPTVCLFFFLAGQSVVRLLLVTSLGKSISRHHIRWCVACGSCMCWKFMMNHITLVYLDIQMRFSYLENEWERLVFPCISDILILVHAVLRYWLSPYVEFKSLVNECCLFHRA